MLYGNRTVNIEGTMELTDDTSGLRAELDFGPEKKKGFFRR
jgi:hypothetical protein